MSAICVYIYLEKEVVLSLRQTSFMLKVEESSKYSTFYNSPSSYSE